MAHTIMDNLMNSNFVSFYILYGNKHLSTPTPRPPSTNFVFHLGKVDIFSVCP